MRPDNPSNQINRNKVDGPENYDEANNRSDKSKINLMSQFNNWNIIINNNIYNIRKNKNQDNYINQIIYIHNITVQNSFFPSDIIYFLNLLKI